MGKAKAIFLLGISGLLVVLVSVIIGVNATDHWDVWLIFTRANLNAGTLLAYSAVLGAVLWAIWRKAVPAGFRALRESRKAERAKVTQDRLKKLETGEPAEAAGAESAPADTDTDTAAAASADETGQ